MKHIEIIGPAGAGKTTILKELTNQKNIICEECSMREIIIQSYPRLECFPEPIQDSICNIQWRIVRPKYIKLFKKEYETASSIMNEAGLQDNRSKFPEVYFRAAAKFVKVRHSISGPVIFDESLHQWAFTIYRINGKEVGDKYLKTIPTPELIIAVDCPAEVCIKRQKERTKPIASSISNLNYQQAIESIDESRQDFILIRNRLKNLGVNVINIDTSEMSIVESLSTISQNPSWQDLVSQGDSNSHSKNGSNSIK